MLIISSGESKNKFNKPLIGLKGQYTLAEGVSLPYFLCNMPIERVINELKIAEQVPASLEAEWSLKELFQREIDEDRVKNDIIKSYLLDSKKLKFFNAITIVLMPIGKDEKIQDQFQDTEEENPPPIPWDGSDTEDAQWDCPEAKKADFGGVQFVHIGEQARLRWDANKILAVAVDGQHRLWALRTFRENEEFRNGVLREAETKTRIPVIFILLHSKAGFINEQDQVNHSIRSISRELFTDLNKNAKTVDRARELILDDKSIHARCVRTLLTDSTSKDIQNQLPLSLVRWQDDVNKFDNSYYLNSLVHLDLLVKALLDLNEPKDPMEEKQIKNYIKDINQTLGIDGKEVEYEGRTLTQYYEEDCRDEDGNPETPFSRLPEYYLGSAIKGFENNFSPWLIKLLIDFKPYRNLLKYARENNLIEGTFGQFQAQTTKHKTMIKREKIAVDSDWFKREIVTPEKHIYAMKDNQWAFKAIFQKAIVRLGKIVEFEYNGEDENLGNIENILSFLDHLYDQRILEVRREISNLKSSLWTFIALNRGDQKIKVSKPVEDRIFSILLLWYYGSRKLQQEKKQNNSISSSRKLLVFFRGQINKAEWPGCTDAYNAIEKGFSGKNFYDLYGQDKNELFEDKQKQLIREHFSKVLAAGIPELANKVDEASLEDEELD
ncbi:MAG TPA: DNA sulfur modification protein DndB [Coleofasciculaceae cyanobacterium]|jgi:hypothetical protein